MRGKHYNDGSRRVFSSGGYIGVIIAVIVIATLIAITLLVLLPTTKPVEEDTPGIVSISYDKTAIGVGSNLAEVYVTVVYSNGDTKQVALSSMQYEGLDVTVDGTQNVSLNYGGFEQTIAINVKNVDCVLTYTAGNGGRIQGTAVQTVVSGSDAATVRAVPETGYTFKEWSDGYPLAERTDKAVNETREYLAKFTKMKFNVTFFFYDGTAQKTEQVNYGESAINIPDETDPRMKVYGYTFVGWSVAEEDYKNVKRDVNVYPRYEKTATDVSVEVSRDKYGQLMGETDAHEFGYYAQSDVERATIIATPNPSTTFIGWEVLNSDGEYVSLGRTGAEEIVVEIGDNREGVSFRVSAANNTDSYSVSFFCTDRMEYVALKADFAYLTSTITFVNYQNKYTNNVEGTVDDVAYDETIGEKIARAGVSAEKGVTVVIDDDETSTNRGLPIPASVAGMTFLGWYRQTDATQSVITAQQTFIEPTNLIAKWEKNEYRLVYVYYDENYNEVIYNDSTVVLYQNTVGSGGGLPAGVPYKDCYVFTGWYDAYTETLVDDATQIIKYSEYDNGEDFANGKIRILAAWAAIAHTLRVEIEGEGTVEVTDDDGQTVEVLGETEIYENHTYRAAFRANEGYEISSVVWTYGEQTDPFSGSEVAASGSYVNIDEKQDNFLRVSYAPKTFGVRVQNGNAYASGYVTRTLQTGESAIYDGELITDWQVNYGADLFFTVRSVDESYAILSVVVSREGRADETVFSATDTPTTYLPVTISDCRSDVTVRIEYKTVTYVLSVNQSPYEEGGNTYPIMETKLNGRDADRTLPDAQREYALGQTVYYVVTAKPGEYVTALLFDGLVNDLYTSTDSLIFYDWVVNGNSIGITLKYIDGEYYYCYGLQTGSDPVRFAYNVPAEDGTEFLYCQRVSDGATVLFEVIDEAAGDYVPYETPANAAGEGQSVVRYLYALLNISERDLFDASVLQNRMITSVKVAVTPEKNLNVSATFAPIEYAVDVEESEFGSVYATRDRIPYGGDVTLSAETVTGYRLVGYVINGKRTDLSEGRTAYDIVLTGVTYDVNVTFLYEVITYNVLFVNTDSRTGNVYVSADGGERVLLNNSHGFVLEYAEAGTFVVTTEEGKVLKTVKVNGEAQTLLFNATTYTYTNYNVTAAVKVEVTCGAEETNDPTGSGYTVTVADADNVSGAVKYNVDGKNVIVFVADKGYSFKSAGVSGVKDGVSVTYAVDFTQSLPAYATTYDDGQRVELAFATDAFDNEATAVCTMEAKSFLLSTTAVTPDGAEGGSISDGMILYYGRESTVTVNANVGDGYYISSFRINGKEISFVSANWHNKVASSSVGKYTAGNYTFIASEDVTAEATFEKISYKVTLDANSINGATEFYINDNTEGNNRISHGDDLIVSMAANDGYHISRVLINGEDAGYSPYTDVANDNTMDSFLLENVTENVNVYVVYEINRYRFNYRLVNASVNFGSEDESVSGNTLTCSDAVNEGNGVYGNIAYGDNFSFLVTPGVNKGYYVYSIRIEYTGYKDGSRTRYAGDGFSANGGVVWFNRFLWDNNLAGSVGVTADVSLIEVTFKKHLYAVSTEQTGDSDGGTIGFGLGSSLSSDGRIHFFDGEGEDAKRYVYTKTTGYEERGGVLVTVDTVTIYRYENGVLTPTDYAYTYLPDGADDGRWLLYSASEDKTMKMYLEYGLRYTIYTYNTEGYELTELTINGESRLRNVYNNSYSFNVYGTGEITVRYEILTFDVTLGAVAYQSNNAEVPTRNLLEYVNVRILTKENGEIVELGALQEGKNAVTVHLDYGTIIWLEITPDFEGKGAFVNTLQRGTAPLNLSDFDVMDVVLYGGDNGIRVVDDLTYKATLKIKEYTVTVSTLYEETYNGEYITNETKNQVSNDATGANRWSVSWGNDTTAKILTGTGYYVDRVEMTYRTRSGETETVITSYAERGEVFGGMNLGYLVNRNLEDALYDFKDTLTLFTVKGDYSVRVYFAREEFDLMFTVSPMNYIEGVRTQINLYNATYPTRDERSETVGWQIKTHYYDELTVTITPKDGYKLVSNTLTVYCLEFDEETGTYKAKLDENNRRVDYVVYLSPTGQGDEMTFTFRTSNSSIASHYVSGAIRLQIELNIKEYRSSTTVNTSQIDVITQRETVVTTAVKDMTGNNLVVGNVEQTAKEIRDADSAVSLTVQHHGTIQYTFTTPVGYMMTGFTANGYSFEELKEKGIVATDVETKVITKENGSDVVSYFYNIVLNVNSTLIEGSPSPWAKTSDLVVNITVAPVTYYVKVVINGNVYDVTTIGGRVGATDGREITVYVPAYVLHFGSLNVEPVMYTGYEIKDSVTDIFFGTEDEYTMSSVNAVEFRDVATAIRARSNFYLIYGMANSDATVGKNYIYFIFNTGIIRYTEEIYAKVYYSESNGAGGYTPVQTDLNRNNTAGSLVVNVVPREGAATETDLGDYAAFNRTLDYFTVIRIEASANAGYRLYGLYEIVKDEEGNDVNVALVNGLRNVTYTVTDAGKYTILIRVEDTSTQILGNRRFLFDFRQQTTVTLTIANPYKYISTTRRYAAYAGVTAYTSANEFAAGIPSTQDVINYEPVAEGTMVIEKYTYTVYVGNYIKFVITDRYVSAAPTVAFYDYDLSGSASYAFDDALETRRRSDLGLSGHGEKINGETNFYAYVQINARITVNRTSVSASSSVGGTVAFNGVSSTSGVLNDDNTAPGRRLTISVTPNENFEFYQFKLRQISDASTQRGYIVFETSEVSAFTAIRFDQLTSSQAQNTFAKTNKLKLLSVTQSGNTVSFTIWVLGDAEFEVEFYRTYSISYGIYLTDKVAQNGASGITSTGVTFDSVEDEVFGNTAYKIASGSTNAKVSYGASFNVRASVPTGEYQFVGWYVNGYDLYQYLDGVLPGADNLYQKVIVTLEEMPSLISDSGAEATDLTLYAIFQPILDVMIYNEKYYAYADHFNSWNLDTVIATYYDFTRGQPIRVNQTSSDVKDDRGKTIEEGKDYLEGTKAYQAYEENNSYGKEWSGLLNDPVADAYSESLRTGGYKVYTSYREFTVLFQNVTDGDVLTNSWADTNIELALTNVADGTSFLAWQYYNWDAKKWMDIMYTYEDRSYGMTSSGSYVTVSCYYSTYALNLSALYAIPSGSNSVLMPYAVSATNSNNVIRYASDLAGVRPLLIRPNVYKSASVELTQNLYLKDLGAEDPEQNILSESIIRPRITDVSGDKVNTNDNGKMGTYEYGSTITIVNNAIAPGETVLEGTTRYRFIGWFIKYRDRLGQPYRLYYLPESDVNEAGDAVGSYRVRLTCKSDMANTNFLFIALYVAQRKQVISSYNVSGAEMESYASAASGENGFYNAAPKVTVSATTSEPIVFNTFGISSNGLIGYDAATINKYYDIVSADTDRSVVTKTGSGSAKASTDFAGTGWSFEYYFDVGLTYSITIPETAPNAINMNAVRSNATGYCPETDTLYKYMKNRDTKDMKADYSSYYNTGHGTYYDGTNTLTVAQMQEKTQADVGTVVNDKEDSIRSNQYDLMYVTTATLVFYNLTYKGGVSLSPTMASALTGKKSSSLTVWDEDPSYGDYNAVSNGAPVGLGANGEVVVRITLICVTNLGYKGTFRFAFAGMQNGRGFATSSELSSSVSATDGLFSPSKDGEVNGSKVFYRWKEVNLSSYATTFLFGNPNGTGTQNAKKVGTHTMTAAKYTTENCGDPINGYRIYNVSQLKMINDFWSANNESCVGVLDPLRYDLFEDISSPYQVQMIYGGGSGTEEFFGRTRFRLIQDRYILSSNSSGTITATGKQTRPTSGLSQWTAICKGTTTKDRTYWDSLPSGFDGILDGDRNDDKNSSTYAKIVGMIASPGSGTYYGLFARVNGGVLTSLIVDNAYIVSDSVEYVGVLAGESRYGTFTDIYFRKCTDYAIYADGAYKNTITNGTRSYITTGGSAAGTLVGRAIDTAISAITLEIGDSGYSMEVNATTGEGLLVGMAEGTETMITTISLSSGGGWIFVGANSNGGVTGSYAGGLIGYMRSGAVAQNILIDSSVNMMIGENYSTVASGGIVGHIEENTSGEKQTTLQYVTYNANNSNPAENFTYNLDGKSISGVGIFVLASVSAGYGDKAARGETGSAGGFVGWNSGVVNNLEGGTYYPVRGVVKLHAGSMGGIVGANSGRVTGFNITTGYSGGYTGMTILAWVSNEAYTYNVGGIAGVNAKEYEMTGTVEVPVNDPYAATTINRYYSGLVDDCSFTGSGSTALSSGDTDWRAGHLYVFVRNCYESNATETGYLTVPGTGNPGGSEQFTYINNIMAGGLVGYNTGSVINSFVNNTKITVPVRHNASDIVTGEEFLAGNYTFGIILGLIAGYHEPSAGGATGWGSSMVSSNMANGGIRNVVNTDLISGRIQSCYSYRSVLVVTGRAWMDYGDNWTQSGTELYSKEYVVSMGGITGGAGSQLGEYSLNSNVTYANEYRYMVVPWGATRGQGGWYRWDQSGAFAKDIGYSECIHGYYQVEVNGATLTSGVSAHDSKSSSKGQRNMIRQDETIKYTAQISGYRTKGDTGRHLGGVKWGELDISENEYRSVVYVNSNVPNEYSSSGTASMYFGSGGISVTDEDGFVGVAVSKTDIQSGLMYYGKLPGLMLVRKGATVSGINSTSDYYAYTINGEEWNFYNSLEKVQSYEPTPSKNYYCVRGQ